jgi:hypothetical protein
VLLAGTSYPAIPACIAGTHAAFPKGAVWPRRHPITVVLGDAVTYEREVATRDGWRRVAGDLERRVHAFGEASAERRP